MYSQLRIKECEAQIARNTQRMNALSTSSMFDAEYRKEQISKLTSSNDTLTTELNEHKVNPLDVDPNIKPFKKPVSKKKMPVIKVVSPVRKSFVPSSGNREVSETTLNNAYAKLLDIEASLPEYIIRNLKNLPNNKGYYWRGVAYYGERNDDCSGVTSLIEPKKGFMYIHEITSSVYNIFSKKGRDKGVLVSSVARK